MTETEAVGDDQPSRDELRRFQRSVFAQPQMVRPVGKMREGIGHAITEMDAIEKNQAVAFVREFRQRLLGLNTEQNRESAILLLHLLSEMVQQISLRSDHVKLENEGVEFIEPEAELISRLAGAMEDLSRDVRSDPLLTQDADSRTTRAKAARWERELVKQIRVAHRIAKERGISADLGYQRIGLALSLTRDEVRNMILSGVDSRRKRKPATAATRAARKQ